MKLKSYLIAGTLLLAMLFTGCSKEVEEYNKPAMYWYSKIVEQISQADLEQADSYYSSLQGEHIGSPLLPEATMILAIAHMQYEEYVLSEHFLDEYIKRYATPNEKEEAEFLKIKAKYKALPNPRRDQALIDEALEESKKFKQNYPNSMYIEIINTMMTRLYLAQEVLNETIINLYDRLDKHKSADYYRSIKKQDWIVWDDIDRANASWYRAWFEGDGTSSWYEYMIPDTQSVVSRNSISEEINLESPSESKTDSEVKELKELNSESNTEKEKSDNSSWYDFMNPFSDSNDAKETSLEDMLERKAPNVEEVKEKEAVEETDTSSWYDFMNPFSNNGDVKKENENHEA